MLDGVDRHGAGCDCGECDSNGKAYEASIYALDGGESRDDEAWWRQAEPLSRHRAPTETGAVESARRAATDEGWKVAEAE